jgi:hypothetical protein
MLTPERIKQLLIYDPDTGEFVYRIRTGNKAQGRRASATTGRRITWTPSAN